MMLMTKNARVLFCDGPVVHVHYMHHVELNPYTCLTELAWLVRSMPNVSSALIHDPEHEFWAWYATSALRAQ